MSLFTVSIKVASRESNGRSTATTGTAEGQSAEAVLLEFANILNGLTPEPETSDD